jgi:CBS domain-containing protein
MLVRELMTFPAVTIRPDNEAVDAARLLDRLSLTSLPVVDAALRLLRTTTWRGSWD